MSSQAGVGGGNDSAQIAAGSATQQVGVQTRTATRRGDSQHGGVPHRRVSSQHVLDILRPDVQPGGQDDQVLRPTDQPDIAVRVDPRQVAGGVPAIPQHLGGAGRIPPITAHHVRTTYQQLTVGVEAHVDTANRRADAARRGCAIRAAAGDNR